MGAHNSLVSVVQSNEKQLLKYLILTKATLSLNLGVLLITPAH